MGRRKENQVVGFSVNRKTEPDLAKWLDNQDNKTKSMKFLIRLAIKSYKNEDLVKLGLLHSTLTIGSKTATTSKSETFATSDKNNDVNTKDQETGSDEVESSQKPTQSKISDDVEDKVEQDSVSKQNKDSETDTSSNNNAKNDPFRNLGV
ncbi:hypothetical protein [Lactobacillus crispatus]|jgi:hypothetical protein|uniref:Uncharacterized protein n=1 Tax=Lactobacillus crispatus TaxID=47770 RepID=A0AAW8WMC6_9LACO|nr:hypothetical protein [Lactobacillus crispatus]STX18416.1 Uncharacterised protein [Lactobacillus acidophilus]MCT7696812.1 hypothetical protein [Lactobacillus crispatus]MCT7708287.1 hypothetical protein [Lactobacillus crispatus]MCT7730774.1 hypothetical protein [Lactobacillus crispatus]MCT7802454.1 hypothetical protein [Lactobacillus crispatus]